MYFIRDCLPSGSYGDKKLCEKCMDDVAFRKTGVEMATTLEMGLGLLTFYQILGEMRYY